MTQPNTPEAPSVGGIVPPEEAAGIYKRLGHPDIARSGLGWMGKRRGGVPGVYDFLEMGAPRLALARALGCPFAPWGVSLTAVFNSTAAQLVANVAADSRFSFDVWVQGVIARITNLNTPTNVFQTMSDFFQNWQNAFQLKLFVQGAPRYSVFEKFTRLSNAMDMLNPEWPSDWILTYDQQLSMDIQSTFTLPTSPLEVQVTFRTMAPVGDMWNKLTNEEAFRRLFDACGIECSDAYMSWHCR